MIGFLIVMGVLIALALAFVLPPLIRHGTVDQDTSRVVSVVSNIAIRRDQLAELEADVRNGALSPEQFEFARRELQERVLEEAAVTQQPAPAGRQGGRWVAVALGVMVPLVSVGLYLFLGNPQALSPQTTAPMANPHAEGQSPITFDKIDAMAAQLAARLQQNPNDGEGWAMLARSYHALGRYAEAGAAYAKATVLLPNDAQLLADYADALALSRDRHLDGEPMQILQRALKVDPDNLKALALAGTAAFDEKDYAGAVKHWERLARLAPPDSELAQSVKASISEAQTLAAGGPLLGPAATQRAAEADAPAVEVAAGAKLSGRVTLKGSLANAVAPTDTVFVFARAAEGPRMPLAIVTAKAKDLPLEFVLDDSTAMAPELKLSSFQSVVVIARISKAGNATAQSGDLQGMTGPVRAGTSGIELQIGEAVK